MNTRIIVTLKVTIGLGFVPIVFKSIIEYVSQFIGG